MKKEFIEKDSKNDEYISFNLEIQENYFFNDKLEMIRFNSNLPMKTSDFINKYVLFLEK